jgi:hypothetical protein
VNARGVRVSYYRLFFCARFFGIWIDVAVAEFFPLSQVSSSGKFIDAKRHEAEAREEMLRRAIEEQLQRNNVAEHALPIERLMDRLSSGEKLNPEEYALISAEIARIQARNQDHLARLESLIENRVADEGAG